MLRVFVDDDNTIAESFGAQIMSPTAIATTDTTATDAEFSPTKLQLYMVEKREARLSR